MVKNINENQKKKLRIASTVLLVIGVILVVIPTIVAILQNGISYEWGDCGTGCHLFYPSEYYLYGVEISSEFAMDFMELQDIYYLLPVGLVLIVLGILGKLATRRLFGARDNRKR